MPRAFMLLRQMGLFFICRQFCHSLSENHFCHLHNDALLRIFA